MSYKSPITVFSQEKFREIREKQEELVLKRILDIGVDVDKDELIKALAYDRDQYRMGYEDGLRANGCRWVSTMDALPEVKGKFLCIVRSPLGVRYDLLSFAPNLSKVDDNFGDDDYPGFYYFDREWGNTEVLGVTHWMPLPEKPKM